MVEACICLDCGSIRWRDYGTYDKHFFSSTSGILEESIYLEYDSSVCNECDSIRLNFFNLEMLSDQECVLFFHYNSSRRLLMFLRLVKVTRDLIKLPLQDNWIGDRIEKLEQELNL